MTFTRLLDEIGVRNMWLYRRPPVESTPADAMRLARTPDAELHVPATSLPRRPQAGPRRPYARQAGGGEG